MADGQQDTLPEQQAQELARQNRRERRCFVALLLAVMFLSWIFIWQQRQFIERPGLFATLILLLLAFSFWSSATEAAYSVVATQPEPEGLAAAIDAAARKLSEAADENKVKEHPEAVDNRPLLKLVQRRRSLKSVYRDRYVGAFASASVFANTALVAFIPAAMATNVTSTSLDSLLRDLGQPELSQYVGGPKMLTFVASTFLLLLLGKVVPKMVGFRFPHFFTYSLGPAADAIQFLFGWIPRGAKYPLTGVLRKAG